MKKNIEIMMYEDGLEIETCCLKFYEFLINKLEEEDFEFLKKVLDRKSDNLKNLYYIKIYRCDETYLYKLMFDITLYANNRDLYVSLR